MVSAQIDPTVIDICIVATRRPGLLEKTLRSFGDHLFRQFRVRRIIANIDPLFGGTSEEAECVAMIRALDPEAEIRLPEKPSFTMAVISNWLATKSDVIFHLEDDWLLHREVHPDHLQPLVDYPWLSQISFNHANKRWNVRKQGPFCYARRHVKLLGHKFSYGPRRQNFLTGPSFLRGSFAREAARLMDPAFDPEKQFCRGLNPRLERYVADHRNMIIGEIGDYYIEDLGRPWRDARHISKRIVAGQSHWSGEAPASMA